jgi:uncharacterized HAD superfamily protein
MHKELVLQAAAEAYYLNPKMVRFLLTENLALKSLLHEKGLITPEEFKKHQEQAAAIIEIKEREQMVAHLKKLTQKDSGVSPSPSVCPDQPQSEQQTSSHDS